MSAKKTSKDVNEALLENFVNLQRVLTNLSVKFEDLSSNISKLLQLFEISAKSFAEKYPGDYTPAESDKELLSKLDSLLEQNKVISKGIMLMEERIRDRNTSPVQQLREGIRSFSEEPRQRSIPRY